MRRWWVTVVAVGFVGASALSPAAATSPPSAGADASAQFARQAPQRHVRTLSIVAGTGDAGGETPGPAVLSMLNNPTGVATDAAGNLYIADPGNECIEKVTSTGLLSVVAGTGQHGHPIPGPALHSTFDEPFAVAVNPRGGLYVADDSHIEKISRTGVLSMIAGTTSGRSTPTPGPALDSSVGDPKGLAVGPHGSLYIADTLNSVVEKINPQGMLSVFAGTGTYGHPRPGPARHSPLALPSGIAVTRHGTVFIADAANEVIERVGTGHRLSIVAGNGHFGTKTGRIATTSSLGYPTGVALDPQGHLDILSLTGRVDQLNNGALTRLAGTGKTGAPTIGPARHSDFGEPFGLAIDRTGRIFVADQQNNVIEQITQ